MATALQLRKGNTLQHAGFTGLSAEVTVDTDKNTLIVHDGATQGGHEVALISEVIQDLTAGSGITVTTSGGNATVSIDYDDFDSDVLPTSNAVYSLGSSTKAWDQIHAQQLLLKSGSSDNTAQIQHLGINSANSTTNSTAITNIDTISATSFRSARYTVQITNNTDDHYHVTEILLLHDGNAAHISEYGVLYTDTKQAVFSADVSGGLVRLRATPSSSDSMTFKVVRHSIIT